MREGPSNDIVGDANQAVFGWRSPSAGVTGRCVRYRTDAVPAFQ